MLFILPFCYAHIPHQILKPAMSIKATMNPFVGVMIARIELIAPTTIIRSCSIEIILSNIVII